MNASEINRAIAEECGERYHKPTEQEILSGSYYQYEPNYCGDLNTMHLAEKTLSNSETFQYTSELQKAQGTYAGKAAFSPDEWEWHATAAQRAEAFLRTKGRWKE